MKKRKSLLWIQPLHRAARFLFWSRLLGVFLVLCVLGVVVGASTRPDPRRMPYAELFGNLSVVSYRDSPSDSAARFLVELASCGRTFAEYDVDARRFLPPPRERGYTRTITGARYAPMRVRGHVAQGLWLELPKSSDRSLLPEQFDEVYQTTFKFVRPVSLLTGVLGMLSGYSVGYRLGAWNSSLCSRPVQERVLATPGLGRMVAREAWRRVLLEPVMTVGEDRAARFAAVRGSQRLYTNFFRLALNDSDGFIPREAARLEALGHEDEARAMLAFTAAARRAADDSAALGSADFEAIERWASLLDRRGHWAEGAIPPAGEERVRYLGTLAWYGLEPPAPEVDRVWVGSRTLVQVGDAEGFVTDEIPATGVGCPVAWRPRLAEANTNVAEIAGAWFADRPEFAALATLSGRMFVRAANTGRQLASLWHERSAARAPVAARHAPGAPPRTSAVVASTRAPAVTPAPPESAARLRPIPAGLAPDSAAGRATRSARDTLARADSLARDSARSALVRTP